MDLEVLETITRAVLDQEEITFTQTKAEPGAQPILRHVRPRHLASIDRNWYVFTDDLDRDSKERQFALSRIEGVQSTGIRFVPKKKFDLEKRLNGSIGAHTAGEKQLIRLRFSPDVRTFVLERDWHSTQKFTPHEDGSVELTFTAPVNAELQRFVFRWGPDVEVLEPAGLRDSVIADARRMLVLYGGN